MKVPGKQPNSLFLLKKNKNLKAYLRKYSILNVWLILRVPCMRWFKQTADDLFESNLTKQGNVRHNSLPYKVDIDQVDKLNH